MPDPGAALFDPLTTLYTRPVFEAVLAKELVRAARFGHPLAIMLFDVDGLRTVNASYGDGVGDRILERLGILVRTYFRELDWVARDAEDGILVLLPQTPEPHAVDLAEGLRAMVEERLAFEDHRGQGRVGVTLSGALVTLAVQAGDHLEIERMFAELTAALSRAKQAGGNRIEHARLEPDAATRTTTRAATRNDARRR
jgi:diguanylate cyclase (GGDEF)-like protein